MNKSNVFMAIPLDKPTCRFQHLRRKIIRDHFFHQRCKCICRMSACFNFTINFYQPIIKLTAKAVYALREAGFDPGFPAGGKAEPSVWSPARNSHAAKSRSVIRQP
ncbi:hypothetical protein CULT_2250006 [[Clostridium] ultunense Esp]|nr:hypothetical protein CULT_2250006 [[Clostridium] ultunense Esp]